MIVHSLHNLITLTLMFILIKGGLMWEKKKRKLDM
jgi:hypothetical protein